MNYIVARSNSVCMYSDFRNNVFKLSIEDGEYLDRFLQLFGSVARKQQGVYIVDRAHQAELLAFIDEVLASENTVRY